MSVKLYVAGVSWTTTDEGFKNFFAQFGAVEEALVMRESPAGRSRGFGFVSFKDPAVAEKVLAQDLELDSRKLDLKRAVPKMEMVQAPVREVDPTPSNKKIYVAGIAFDATDEQVAQFFSRFGQVEKATIMKDKLTSRSRGFAFVSFVEEGVVDEILAQHAANKLEWEGRTLDLKAAVPKGAAVLSSFSHGSVARNKKLYVAGLLQSTTDEALLTYFSKFGVVTEAIIQKNHGTGESRGFGFVTFQDASSVDRVLEQSHMLDNQSIDCKVAVPKIQQPMFQMGGAGGGYSSAWNTPSSQHFSNSGGTSAFNRALDVRDVRNNAQSDRGGGGFEGYGTNQGGNYPDRFGPVGGSAYDSGGHGTSSGLGGLGGGTRLPAQGSYGNQGFGGGASFDNSYDHGAARAPNYNSAYGRTDNYYSAEDSAYTGYDRQRGRFAFHPYSR